MIQWLRLWLLMHGVQVWFLVWELRSHMPWSQNNQTINRSSTVTNSVKTLKMARVRIHTHTHTHTHTHWIFWSLSFLTCKLGGIMGPTLEGYFEGSSSEYLQIGRKHAWHLINDEWAVTLSLATWRWETSFIIFPPPRPSLLLSFILSAGYLESVRWMNV